MAKARRLKQVLRLLPLAAVAVPLIGVGFILRPTTPGPAFYLRVEASEPLAKTLGRLAQREVIRSVWGAELFAKVTLRAKPVPVGTYQFKPGMSIEDVMRALRKQIRQSVRIPETNWAQRTANLLQQKGVCQADEYMAIVRNPAKAKAWVSMALPSKTLEGYLYPDTYDLPPLVGARFVIRRQLEAFQAKVLQSNSKIPDLDRTLKVASLVELETGGDGERAVIAGVIENRLKQNMYLQIDASILYGLQKWRRLTYRDYREVDSPYNLYRHKGLPPTPICSPSLKSIEAALNPAKHSYLFYVVVPGKGTVFASTYKEHLNNIKLRRRTLADQERAQLEGVQPK